MAQEDVTTQSTWDNHESQTGERDFISDLYWQGGLIDLFAKTVET